MYTNSNVYFLCFETRNKPYMDDDLSTSTTTLSPQKNLINVDSQVHHLADYCQWVPTSISMIIMRPPLICITAINTVIGGVKRPHEKS